MKVTNDVTNKQSHKIVVARNVWKCLVLELFIFTQYEPNEK